MKNKNLETIKTYIMCINEYGDLSVKMTRIYTRCGTIYQISIINKDTGKGGIVDLDSLTEARAFLNGFWYGLKPF